KVAPRQPGPPLPRLGGLERLDQCGAERAQSLRPMLMVEDGVRPIEAAARQGRLVAQLAALPAQGQVMLARQLAERQPLQHSGLRGPELFAFDALEQRAEVASAEALIALALDDLEEEWARFGAAVQAGGVFQEDLEQVSAARLAIHQDTELSKL